MRLVLRVLGYSLAALGGAFVLLGAVYALVFPTPAQPPRPTASSANSTMPARVLDINIFMRPPGIHNNADDYKNERLLYIQEQILPFYDIIAFQEAFAFGNHRIDRLVASAVQLGFDYVASPRHGPWSLASDGGLLLLSRFPVLQSHTLEYPRGLHSDWMALKGALHLSIRLDGKRHVDVYTTHTQASYGSHGERSKQDILTRLEQFSRFRDFIRQTSSPGVPILALGDFNIDSAAHDGPISQPSVNSSRAYTMMMDVLSGNGTDGAFFGKENEWLFPAASDSDSDAGRIHWKDMLYDTFGAHPVTFGDFVQAANGSLLPAETALTHAQQLLTVQSIDQLLWANMSSSVNLSLVNVTLEKFQVNNEPFTQLSDHYGIACLLV
ncbi:Endonuclease/exonuclease/phosphatase [Gongronella butleri]|nr:Endonuclease/exonuclease/phosphatase [Gongronella butleri]